ncbi:MAG: DUF456 domain-containing protein [Phycisphaerales bacterium]|nr:DUF456 domain-containing protein [Phycisphaerales bacterium]
MLPFVVYSLVLLLSLVGVALNVLSLPGNWIMFVAAVILSACHHWQSPSATILVLMFILLLAGEAIEFFGSVVGARKFGASTAAAWAAIGGTLTGGLIGSFILLIVGSLIGAIVGAFLAALAVELLKQRPLKHATWAAIGAVLGRIVGTAAKLAFGLAAWFALLFSAWPR